MNTKPNSRMNDNEDTVLDGRAMPATAEAGRDIWKKCLIGGVPGIVLGAAGTLAGSSLAAAEPEAEENPEPGETAGAAVPEIGDSVSVAGSVTDDMTFAEAFAAARAELGAGGVFTWHGQVYGTYMQDEWDAMSDGQRQEYAEAVSSTHVHPEPYTPTADEEPVVVVEQTEGGETNPVAQNGGETNPVAGNGGTEPTDGGEANPVAENGATGTNEGDETDIHVLDVVQVDNENGGTAYVGVAEIDGHYAEFQDLDGNGVVDQIVVDLNDNNVADEGEVISVEEAGIQVADLAAAAAYEQQPMPDDNLYVDMPDYTNDADTSSLG